VVAIVVAIVVARFWTNHLFSPLGMTVKQVACPAICDRSKRSYKSRARLFRHNR
jgi:hypothetical protein